jgi:hypothetical protein
MQLHAGAHLLLLLLFIRSTSACLELACIAHSEFYSDADAGVQVQVPVLTCCYCCLSEALENTPHSASSWPI